MNRNIQVDKTHYHFENYMTKSRWCSVWHQLNEVIMVKPNRILEIGPGFGLFKCILGLYGFLVETIDLDHELHPDHVGTVEQLPFENDTYDVVCAFQVLEHLPYDSAMLAFIEMVRVANKYIIISIPDSQVIWSYKFYLPFFGYINFQVPRPRLFLPKHEFLGEHYWEIGKRSYPLSRVIEDFSRYAKLSNTYRVAENPYHRFIVFTK